MIGRGLGTMMLALVAGGCFSGDTTLGSICVDDLDCGADQACTHEVCGRCGDGIPQRGELCTVAAADLGTAPPASPGDVWALDLDRDGRLDLVTRGDAGAPEFWGGDGAGGWTVRTRVDVGGTRGPLRLGDLDEDDAVDLVVVDADAPSIHLGHGDGEGGWSFEPPVSPQSPPLDVAVASAAWAGPAWVAWVDAQGLWQATVDASAGTLAEPVQLVPDRVQWLGQPAPLDDDDALDLAVADGSGRALELWLGDGAGGLVLSTTLALEGRPTELEVVDADGDGQPDLLIPDEDGGVTVILADGRGGLAILERVVVSGPARGVTMADLDRDGRRDLVVWVDADVPLWLWLTRGLRHPDAVALPVEGAIGSLVALDGDRDGLIELILGPVDAVGPLRIVEVDP